ncbi:MAG: hypothetical protein K5651_03595 [Bacteroidales bacterium]|nr:hypothetical protein [Bacteroidales bacterium]
MTLAVLVIVLSVVWGNGTSNKAKEDGLVSIGADKAPAGVEAVDLGLSVKWASCNIGAFEPEEYGDYFAWGETTPKEEYSWATYQWCAGDGEKLSKYCTGIEHCDSCCTPDGKMELDRSDDAASVHWGGKWRTPTAQEWDELLNECDWEWKELNGVSGFWVSSRTNAGKIFLPAAGLWLDGLPHDLGARGFYWSSSLYAKNPACASGFHFYSAVRARHGTFRNDGLSVRPVRD